jgi:deoxyribonuclease-4
MPRFGAHMSISGGLHKAFAQGEQVGCQSLQIFSKNQQQWRAKPLTDKDVALFQAERERSGLGPVVVHDSYLINLASPNDELWEKSIAAFSDELERCAALTIPYLVTHPGAHMGTGDEAGLQRVSDALNRLFDNGIGGTTTVLLETTAGQGSALGHRFEHLAWLIGDSRHPQRLGVCVDTCHILAAGYDIRTPEQYAATFETFDQIVGTHQIKCFHVNDSQKELGSRVDRHAAIGEGFVGIEAFRSLVNDARFADLPMIIETPKSADLHEDSENLTRLRELLVAAQ